MPGCRNKSAGPAVKAARRQWVRRALFQVHSWTGVGVGLYVAVVSLTGSVLVFRQEYYRYFRPGSVIAASTVPRMTAENLTESAKRVYPGTKSHGCR